MSEGKRTGTIRLSKRQRVLDKGKVRDGKTTLKVKRNALKIGKHALKVRYLGSNNVRKAAKKISLRVVK